MPDRPSPTPPVPPRGPVPPRTAAVGDGGWGRGFARRHHRLTVLTVVVVVLLLAAAGAVAVGLTSERGRPGASASAVPCTSTRTVTVVADPTLVTVLRGVAAEAAGSPLSTGVCADVEVVGRPSAEAADLLAADPAALTGDGPPDLWVPDSSVWLGRAVADPPRRDVTLTALGSLVSSPVVVATSPEVVEAQGWAGAGPTWGAVLASGRPVALPDPSTSAAGLQALAALASTAPDAAARREQLGTAAAALRQGAVADAQAAFALVADGGADAPLVPTTEQQVFDAARGSVTTPAVGVRPTGGRTSLDHPVVRVDTPASAAGVDAAAVEGAVRLLETAGREALVVDGFREPLVEGPTASAGASPGPSSAASAPSPTVTSPTVTSPTVPAPAAPPPAEPTASVPPAPAPPAPAPSPPVPSAPAAPAAAPSAPAPSGPAPSAVDPDAELPVARWADVQVLLDRLAELGRPSRVLAVLDATASMRGVTGTGATRARVTEDAVGGTLAQFADTSSAGLWFFGQSLGTDAAGAATDHVEVVPLRPLDPALAGVDQRGALAAGVDQLDARLAPGGTGLYDTVLAAVRSVRAGYDPGAVNTVVVVTDGRQDDPGGPALAEVVATLQAEADPERPVRLDAVGISADVDPAELRALAEATGGVAYLAEQPEDLPAVLADALRRR